MALKGTGPSQAGGPGGLVPPHFLSDQLTLSQPGGAHYPHPVLRAPQIFRPCDGPVLSTYNSLTQYAYFIFTFFQIFALHIKS